MDCQSHPKTMTSTTPETSMLKSTEDLHINHDNNDLHGPFKEFRKMMDTSYFSNYTKSRQKLQDNILKKYLQCCDNNDNQNDKIKRIYKDPWIFFTCGPFGAGKTHSLRYLDKQGVLNLDEYIHIDPDKLKYELPEAQEYILKDPLNAGTNLHKESTFLALMLQYIVLEEGRPMIIDGSLRNFQWNKQHMLKIRTDYPQYSLGIIKIEASIETMLERSYARGLVTGRIVAEELIVGVANDILESFPKYLNLRLCNLYLIVDNNTEPHISKMCLVNS